MRHEEFQLAAGWEYEGHDTFCGAMGGGDEIVVTLRAASVGGAWCDVRVEGVYLAVEGALGELQARVLLMTPAAKAYALMKAKEYVERRLRERGEVKEGGGE